MNLISPKEKPDEAVELSSDAAAVREATRILAGPEPGWPCGGRHRLGASRCGAAFDGARFRMQHWDAPDRSQPVRFRTWPLVYAKLLESGGFGLSWVAVRQCVPRLRRESRIPDRGFRGGTDVSHRPARGRLPGVTGR